MSLVFNAATHRYRCDRKPIQGATTILKAGLPMESLPYWSAKSVAEFVADNPDEVELLREMGREPMVNALKGVPWESRDRAAMRGTEVHALAERVIHGEAVEVPDPEHRVLVQGYVDWLDRFEVDALLTERSCANREHWYAGRFDLVARLRSTTWLLDVKTARGVYGSTALQLAAYAMAEFYVDDDEPDLEHPMPQIERTGVLHVTTEGTELYPMRYDADVRQDWLNVLAVAKRRKQIDAHRLEPITEPDELEIPA